MRVLKGTAMALGAAVALGGMAQAQGAPGQPSLYGVWRNPKNSVHIEIKPCSQGACGYVIWANAKAQADAREGGTANLVGTQLFRSFTPRENGVWKGKVFVPDLNRTFTGSAEPIDARSLRAKGCFIGNVLCKTQIWTRIDS